MAKRTRTEKVEEISEDKEFKQVVGKDEMFFFERGLTRLVQKIVREESEALTREEIKQIINELLPDLDKLVSKIVKSHLREITQYILDKTKEESVA